MGTKLGRLPRNTFRKVTSTILLSIGFLGIAQEVRLSKVTRSHEGGDNFLYAIPRNISDSEYLGELEISDLGASPEDTFALIYKKAHQIGANSFAPVEILDDVPTAGHYFLSLYYTPKKDIPTEENTVYIFSGLNQPKQIAVNDKKTVLSPKSYIKLTLQKGDTFLVSTRSFLGSSVKLTYTDHQSVQYFAVSGMRISQNNAAPGLRLKSADIIGLDKSYAQFLTLKMKNQPF